MDARAADKNAQQQEGQPVQGLIRAGHYRGRHIVGNRLVGKDLLDGVGHTVDVLALQHRSAGHALDALAHHAVFADVDAVDLGAAVLRDRRDLDVRTVLDVEPDGNIKVRFLFKDDALAGNTALDGKRHLERRSAGVQLVIDLLDRHCVGDIEFAGEGRSHRVLQIFSQVSHNRFLLIFLYLYIVDSLQVSPMWSYHFCRNSIHAVRAAVRGGGNHSIRRICPCWRRRRRDTSRGLPQECPAQLRA